MREDAHGRHGPGAWSPQAWEFLSGVPPERAAGSQAGEPATCHAGDSRVGVLGCGSGPELGQAVPRWVTPSSVATSVNQATFKSLAILGLKVPFSH